MARRPSPIFLPSRRSLLKGTLAIAATTAGLPRSVFGQERQVNIYNWDTYIGADTVDEFSEATGIAVRYDLFASNDELFAKLREGNPGYDVIFPSNDFVERMIVGGMLEDLDHGLIPNLANIDPAFLQPAFDPGRAYSVPYFWGTMGIGFRSSKASPVSWAALLESDEHKGRMAMLNTKDTIQIALKYLGYSANTLDAAQIDEAAELLIRAKPNFKTFAPDTGQDLLIAGEVDLTAEWNGDILQVMAEDDDLSFVVPKEGTVLWEDTMCIPKDAPHPEEAHAWINYILTAEVHGQIANEVRYACPNAAALEYVDPADRANPALYPPQEVLERCEVSIYKGEEIEGLYARALTRVLAA